MKPKISVITPSIRPAGLQHAQDGLSKQTMLNEMEWLVELGIPERGCDLSASLNRMLRRAKGELVIFLQDYINIPEDGLEMFWNFYNRFPDTFFTGSVGWDWRNYGNMRDIQPHEWEADWAAAPLKAFFDVGGYDEEFDKGWSWENVNLAQRALLAGYKFKVLPLNKAKAYDHDEKIEHPFRGKNENAALANNKWHKIKLGEYELDYLTK